MKNKPLNNILLIALSVIFSFGLMFAFVELPVLLDSLLQTSFGSPGFDQAAGEINAYKSELFIDGLYLRWIGYGSLALIVLFIIIGLTTKKSGWAFLGAFALFIPVFGQFAFSMFFLAGLSILRVGWLPFMDISFNVLSLGDIIYLPYNLLMSFFGLFNWDAHLFLSYFFMFIGAFLFVWGVLVWMQTKFGSTIVATSKIYKFSRHPQYLGWIIWSYGLVLFSSTVTSNIKVTWSVPSSLPWLLSTMVIVAICLIEEIKMEKESGDSYDEYRKNTPFLLPLPKWLADLFKYPTKIFTRKEFVEKRSDVIKVTTFYTVTLILLSLFWIDFNPTPASEAHQLNNSQKTIDSLVTVIKNTSRRTFDKQFDELIALGDSSIPTLITLVQGEDENIREFAAEALGKLKATEAIPNLGKLINDNSYRVENSCLSALGNIQNEEALKYLLQYSNDNNRTIKNNSFYSALGNYHSQKIDSILINGLSQPMWHTRNAALNALHKSNPKLAIDYTIKALSDTDPKVIRNALNIILLETPISAEQPLKRLLDNEDFEVRFFAKQSLDLINEKKLHAN